MGDDWSYGLFGCFGNLGLCLITYLAPCYTAGKNAEHHGESCLVYGFLSMLGCIGLWSMTRTREKTRIVNGIEGSYTGSLLTVWCCTLCALIQEAQELEHMGQSGAAMARE